MIESNSTIKRCPKKDSKLCIEGSYLGVVPYQNALQIQKSLARLSAEKNQISVVGLEHPDIITLGRRASEQSDLHGKSFNLETIRSSRGGLATIHSYGQLVIYPILNLRSLELGIRDYVEILLRSTQQLLLEYGIETECQLNAAGLFTESGKIAFCGIEVSKGITQHGLSLNVRNDLELFSAIRSCGVENMKLDRMINYQFDDNLENLFNKWIFYFKKNMTNFF